MMGCEEKKMERDRGGSTLRVRCGGARLAVVD